MERKEYEFEKGQIEGISIEDKSAAPLINAQIGLTDALDNLEREVNTIIDRLLPVTQPAILATSTSELEKSKSDLPKSDAVMFLENKARQARYVASMLYDVRSRLDV